uniref:Small ribosomal subunit protein uS3c n=1 Tax=Euglenaformis proxima TaxID=299110 RepID=A0A023HHW3_9EUGL|nr:ribosomal protein S3 [Euglenaformis proxima]AGL12005.1 ribosomal protein S3 [Euglenaformis proxima]
MGQKINPLGFRIGISKTHSSIWYSNSKKYFNFLNEDIKIRKFLTKKLISLGLSMIEIHRKSNYIFVNIHVLNPASLVNSQENNLYLLRSALTTLIDNKITNRELVLNIVEVTNPDLNARLLSYYIQEQLEKRVPFRKVIRTTVLKAQKAGTKGIKIQIAGRLNGAEIARTEWFREGQVPLHTLKANVDYCSHTAQTVFGILGIKIWVYVI